jgi:hypothetical protein
MMNPKEYRNFVYLVMYIGGLVGFFLAFFCHTLHWDLCKHNRMDFDLEVFIFFLLIVLFCLYILHLLK